jgi:hypothetical protein
MTSPIPIAKKNNNTKLMGKNKSAQVNPPPSAIIKINKAINERKLSIRDARAMLKGNRAFGRYIFLIRPSLLIKAIPDWVTTALKKFQGIIAANKKMANVLRSTLKSVENTMAITDIIINGLTRVQK